MVARVDQWKDKAFTRIVEARARGIIASSEIHGTEIPGFMSACMDAGRETMVLLLLLHVTIPPLTFSSFSSFLFFSLITFGWLIWKVGRSAWLGWSRLERLHRILEEERWEIEHCRPQEREGLRALYLAKGFEGELLENVLDVLMADGDRLLRVMVEEELGLSLNVHEHPLRQGLGAGSGVLFVAVPLLLCFWLESAFGLYLISGILLGVSGYLSAVYQGNRPIPAIIWNLALAVLAVASTKFLSDYFAWRNL